MTAEQSRRRIEWWSAIQVIRKEERLPCVPAQRILWRYGADAFRPRGGCLEGHGVEAEPLKN